MGIIEAGVGAWGGALVTGTGLVVAGEVGCGVLPGVVECDGDGLDKIVGSSN